MSCDELKEQLIDYVRGAGDRAAVEAHVAHCPACRDALASLGSVWEKLARWPDEIPSDALKGRVLAAFDGAEPLPRAHPGLWHSPTPYLRVALAIVLLATGAWLGAWYTKPATPPPDSRAEFVLFLYDDPVTEAARTPEEALRTVEEYKAWAGGLARAGNLVAGEKLTEQRRLFGAVSGSGPVVPAGTSLGGYFVIRAASDEEAAAIAAGCPHLVHGGAIELRRIDPV